jgi:hypothetical protein
MARRKRLASALTTLVLTIAADAGEFIRVEEDGLAARLQTAITRYEVHGKSVELIGAIHIADKAYYEKLNTRFKSYDALLFEMIGGEKFTEGAIPKALAPGDKDLSGIPQIYSMVSRFLNLSGQSESIDYTANNFVHADLTLAEFSRLQTERGESILGFAMKAAKPDESAPNQPDPQKLMQAMLSGNTNLVKLEIVHTLGRGDDQIAAFVGESVIITDRNHRCLQVLKRELAAGHRNIGIFYGAAHFPDMEKQLLQQGFKRTRQEWLTAWDIPKAEAKPAAELKKAS